MIQRSAARLARGYQTFAILLLNTLLLLLAAELISRPVVRALQARDERRFVTRMIAHSYYARQPWAEMYWREYNRLTQQYEPYTIWRKKPFQGETITITSDGFRQTPNTACSEDALEIFVLGGSTIWGYGAPDEGTIPAYLQEQLAAVSDDPVCVHNLGEVAYVSTQEVVELIRQLQAGHIPDVVIFYDGMNDAAAVSDDGRAGTHMFAAEVADRMTAEPSLIDWGQTTGTYELLARLARKAGAAAPQQAVFPMPPQTEWPARTETVLQTYFTNYQVVLALAHTYGFRVHFFWQPLAVSGQQTLTAEEARLALPSPEVTAYYRQVYKQLVEQSAAYPCLTDLSHLFDDHEETIWLDLVHITPVGNELVAKAMVQVLQQEPPEVCEGVSR